MSLTPLDGGDRALTVERLPDEDKHIIKTLLDAFLNKRQLQTLIR